MKKLFYFIFLLLIVYLLILLCEVDYVDNSNKLIIDDGFIIINNPSNIKNVLNYLPDGYNFINYRYKIKGCTISTFHRDITSSQYIFKTKYPVYTYIVYYNNGSVLSVIPNSHKTVPFSWNKVETINVNYNNGILFNCDLVHAGAINNFGNKRLAIQYKICHYEDLHKLTHLQGINKTTNKDCNNTSKLYEYFLRKLSLIFPYIINHLMTNILQQKPEEDSFLNTIVSNFYIGDFYNK